MPPTDHIPRRRRHRHPLAVALVLALLAPLAALATATPVAAAVAGPTVTGTACAPGTGVTVVVDRRQLGDAIRIGCAPGEQADGMAALANAGFSVNDDDGAIAGTVCQIDGLPTEGYPTCWLSAFWGYSKSDGTGPWAWSDVGVAHGPLPVDSVEGWSWTDPIPEDYVGEAPRITVSDLADHRPGPLDCDLVPHVPALDIVADAEVLPVRLDDGGPTRWAVLGGDGTGTDLPVGGPADLAWVEGHEIDLDGLAGPTRVLAQRAGDTCADAPLFDHTYDVRDAYAPRWNLGQAPGAPSPAVPVASPAIATWATGYADYVPGANVTAGFQTPEGGLGPASSGLVVLGDRGRIDLTFDRPITDGEGYDLAVFENGFAVGTPANEIDFLELGYVEVSSNGTDFVRFDSASRQATPVGGFTGQRADLVGGLAGKDLAGQGTPFDLRVLRNAPPVRAGLVDLDRITHVRIVDVTGDGEDRDSFGRPIYDAHPTVGSAGFDLTGVAVLNVLPRTASESWVEAAHADLIGRAPTPAELADAVARLDAGVHRRVLAGELSRSPEWVSGIVTRFYADTLGRGPDAEGLAYWVEQIRTGRRSVAQVAVLFFASAEHYERAGGTDPDWVADLYRKLLGRAPDAPGLAYWTARAASRGRGDVATAFHASPESRRSRVSAHYQALLGRRADAPGLAYWAGRIATEGDLALAVHLVTSDEHLRRARVRFP